MINFMSDGGGSSGVSVYSELFETTKDAKQSFLKDFEESHKNMKRLFNKMNQDEGLKGKASEGFIELFDITIQYHEAIIKALPDILEDIENFSETLEEIKQESIYRELY